MKSLGLNLNFDETHPANNILGSWSLQDMNLWARIWSLQLKCFKSILYSGYSSNLQHSKVWNNCTASLLGPWCEKLESFHDSGFIHLIKQGLLKFLSVAFHLIFMQKAIIVFSSLGKHGFLVNFFKKIWYWSLINMLYPLRNNNLVLKRNLQDKNYSTVSAWSPRLHSERPRSGS